MSAAVLSLRRIGAMLLRHLYLYRGSWTRVIELAYWPTMQVLTWGLITRFFLTHSSWLVQASGALLAGVLLWDVMFRGQLGLSVSFLEEMWARNLGQLFVTPLHPAEFICSLTIMSLIRTLIGIVPATLLAWLLYEYSIYDMGLPLIAFFGNLIVFGWALGLAVCGVLMRFGLGAESLAWVLVFALAPVSAVYYPVEVLPAFIQPIAWAIPSAYVFEGMRAVLVDGVFRTDLFWAAVGLNVVYLALGAGLFLFIFHIARVRGLLLQSGE